MEKVEITTLQPDDWRQYRDLRLRALKDEPQAYASTYEENAKRPNEFWIERLQDALKEESQWLLFAKQNKDLVGMVGAFARDDQKDTAHIIAVYVVEEARGQGISRKLMDSFIEKIQNNKSIKRLITAVNVEQEAAHNLYRSLGFAEFKKEKMILGDGKEHEVIYLEKSVA